MAARPHSTHTAPIASSGFWAREAEALTFNAAERRAQAPCRFLISIVIGLGAVVILKPSPMLPWLLLWAIVNVAAQTLELGVLWPFRKEVATPGAGRTAAGLAVIALVSLAYAAGSLLLWNLPGLFGPASAVLILGGCLVNVMMLSRGSGAAFAASGAPHALFLVLGPFFARPTLAADRFLPTFAIAEAVFVFGVTIVWRHLERLRREERQARALAETRRAEAEAASAAQTRYAAAVSHELRTPLTAILAAADALARRAPDPQDADAARMVCEAGEMMRRMLDDLLDLAKLQAGHMDVAHEVFSPAALLQDAHQFWTPRAQAAGLVLELEGVDALPKWAAGDPMRIRQILNNLVSNAVKFTGSGYVAIQASCLREPSGDLQFAVEVCDSGRGIAPEQMARLFTPFQPNLGEAGGTGLGLSISRELALLMGGDLGVRASLKGSRFRLTVTLQPAQAPAGGVEASPPPANAPEGRGSRLLVVDDQPLVRRAIGVMLQPLGLEATFAETGADALAQLAVESFDLVMMDVNLSDMDGREVVRRLRATAGPNATTPVLAVTGAVQAGAAESYRASGMTGVLAKPLEPRAFYAALDAALAGEPSALVEAA